MGYKYIHSEVREVESIVRNFMNYGSFKRLRKDHPSCGICHAGFSDSDMVHLAVIKNNVFQNTLVCDICSLVAIENGAEQKIRHYAK